MKTVLLTLCVLLALFQIGSCHPTKIGTEISSGSNGCVSQLKVNVDDLVVQLSQTIISEDNHDAREFFGCFSRALKIQNATGDIDFERLSLVVQEMLKEAMYTPDAATQALQIADSAIDHCKNASTGETLDLRALRMRNCLESYVENLDTYF